MSRRGQIFFFLPALLVFVVFVLIPTTQTLVDSFYAQDGLERRWVGGLYYRYAIGDPKFHQSIVNNLVYLLWTLLFEVTLGLALALGLVLTYAGVTLVSNRPKPDSDLAAPGT